LRLVQTPHLELHLSSQVLLVPSICQQQGIDRVRYCARKHFVTFCSTQSDICQKYSYFLEEGGALWMSLNTLQ
jgi:hypothetical protein